MEKTLSSPGDGSDRAAVVRRATRLFLSAYAVMNLYENVMIGLLRRKNLSNFFKDTLSQSSLRIAGFIASFSTIYRVLLSQLRLRLPSSIPPSTESRPANPRSKSSLILQQRPRLRRILRKIAASPYFAPLVAGTVASSSMLIESSGERRVSIAIYALSRAVQSLYLAACNKGVMPAPLREGRWWFGGHLLFGIANAQLLHSFVYNPDTFPASYSSFILKYSSAYLPSLPPSYPPSTPWPTPREVVDAIASSSRSRYPSFSSPLLHPDSANNFRPDAIVARVLPILAGAHPGHSRLVCAFLHPEETSCWKVFDGFVRAEFKAVTKFFAAFAAFGILIRHKKFLKDPEEGVFKGILATLTNSAFLSLALGTAWGTICLFQQYLPSNFIPTKRFYLQGFLAGLWVSLVTIGGNASRATDLGMYSARLAVNCAWKVATKNKAVKGLKNGEVLYFAAAMGVLMSLYEVQPKAIGSGFVRSALAKMAGKSASDEEQGRSLSVLKK